MYKHSLHMLFIHACLHTPLCRYSYLYSLVLSFHNNTHNKYKYDTLHAYWNFKLFLNLWKRFHESVNLTLIYIRVPINNLLVNSKIPVHHSHKYYSFMFDYNNSKIQHLLYFPASSMQYQKPLHLKVRKVSFWHHNIIVGSISFFRVTFIASFKLTTY